MDVSIVTAVLIVPSAPSKYCSCNIRSPKQVVCRYNEVLRYCFQAGSFSGQTYQSALQSPDCGGSGRVGSAAITWTGTFMM